MTASGSWSGRRSWPSAGGDPPRLNIATPDDVIREGDTLLLVGEEAALTRFFADAGRGAE